MRTDGWGTTRVSLDDKRRLVQIIPEHNIRDCNQFVQLESTLVTEFTKA